MPLTSRHPRRTLAVVLAVLALALGGCGSDDSTPQADGTSLLAEHDLAGLDARGIIERLDAMPVADRPADLLASVRPDVLVVSDGDERETELSMPGDEVYVSVAPYREQTHECHFHSLTTCLGELGNTPVRVELVASDGQVLVDEERTTFDNGFVGMWVPKGIEATLTIRHRDTTATSIISTKDADDPTCITTMQLA